MQIQYRLLSRLSPPQLKQLWRELCVTGKDHFAYQPEDLISICFSFLDPRSASSFRQTCHRLDEIARMPSSLPFRTHQTHWPLGFLHPEQINKLIAVADPETFQPTWVHMQPRPEPIALPNVKSLVWRQWGDFVGYSTPHVESLEIEHSHFGLVSNMTTLQELHLHFRRSRDFQPERLEPLQSLVNLRRVSVTSQRCESLLESILVSLPFKAWKALERLSLHCPLLRGAVRLSEWTSLLHLTLNVGRGSQLHSFPPNMKSLHWDSERFDTCAPLPSTLTSLTDSCSTGMLFWVFGVPKNLVHLSWHSKPNTMRHHNFSYQTSLRKVDITFHDLRDPKFLLPSDHNFLLPGVTRSFRTMTSVTSLTVTAPAEMRFDLWNAIIQTKNFHRTLHHLCLTFKGSWVGSLLPPWHRSWIPLRELSALTMLCIYHDLYLLPGSDNLTGPVPPWSLDPVLTWRRMSSIPSLTTAIAVVRQYKLVDEENFEFVAVVDLQAQLFLNLERSIARLPLL